MKKSITLWLLVSVLICGCGNGNEDTSKNEEISNRVMDAQAESIESEEDNQTEYANYTYDESDYSDAYQKGKEMGDKLNEEMENIDWEENYEKAEEAGKKAAEWLNGLFD